MLMLQFAGIIAWHLTDHQVMNYRNQFVNQIHEISETTTDCNENCTWKNLLERIYSTLLEIQPFVHIFCFVW